MGLDITAYRQIRLSPNEKLDSDGQPKDYDHSRLITTHILQWTENNWPGRTRPLEAGVYRFAESFDFCAGSYRGYNEWRDWLAKVAGHGSAEAVWNKIKAGPFVELIDFADNEGVIGATVAAKLAGDFADHSARIHALCVGDDDWQWPLYQNWHKAFLMAADNGFVDFG